MEQTPFTLAELKILYSLVGAEPFQVWEAAFENGPFDIDKLGKLRAVGQIDLQCKIRIQIHKLQTESL